MANRGNSNSSSGGGSSNAGSSNNSAYQEARSGGRNAGIIKDAANKNITQIQKGIRSFEKTIQEHMGYLQNPEAALEAKKASKGSGKLWGEMSKLEQDGVMKHWKKEVERYTEQKEVLEGILKDRVDGQ